MHSQLPGMKKTGPGMRILITTSQQLAQLWLLINILGITFQAENIRVTSSRGHMLHVIQINDALT